MDSHTVDNNQHHTLLLAETVLSDDLRSCLQQSHFNSSMWALITIHWDNIIRATQPYPKGHSHTHIISFVVLHEWRRDQSSGSLREGAPFSVRNGWPVMGFQRGVMRWEQRRTNGGEKGGLWIRSEGGTAIDQLSSLLTVWCTFRQKT